MACLRAYGSLKSSKGMPASPPPPPLRHPPGPRRARTRAPSGGLPPIAARALVRHAMCVPAVVGVVDFGETSDEIS